MTAQQQRRERPLNTDSNPRSESAVLYRSLSGEAADFEEGEINNIIPTGNTGLTEHQLLLQYQDLLERARTLREWLGIDEEWDVEKRILEKMNFLVHASKSKDGYGLELIVTRKSHSNQNVNEQIRQAAESKGAWDKIKEEISGGQQEGGGMPDGMSLKPENPDNFNAGESW